ncbi:hypothetical protein F5J12DRAFT_781172 [Pisolithus orientalis]|uniref:uncharacterized protein n=1 Tax=Pisolithus orientalis TaxID=936130 RepID=UPI00222588D8|nr:uncharacterized protein F5J12DRAFT_781172 [Pisolithus orientalis]KAI6015119.1 hypothetical protein F5J12DRAFT_781172 [Pisolithus orientalis]
MLSPISVTPATECYLRSRFQDYLLANDLQVRAKKMMACFTESFLPVPTDDLNSAWDELPNDTVDVMPTSSKADKMSLRAPPPTPSDANSSVDGGSSHCGPSSSDRSDEEKSPFVYETDSPTPDVVAFKVIALEPSDSHYLLLDDSGNVCHRSTNEKLCDELNNSVPAEPRQGSEISTSVSDLDGISTGHRSSPRSFPDFQATVDRGVADICQRGIRPFVHSLLLSGVETIQSAPLVSRLANAAIQRISNISYMEAKELTKAIRVGALEMFQNHWKPVRGSDMLAAPDGNANHLQDGDWGQVSSTSTDCSPFGSRGLNTAGLMGSLFNAKVVPAEDILLCLFFLLEGEKRFDRLCAMHALLVQANDQLCKSRNLQELTRFTNLLSIRDPTSGCFAWAPTLHAHAILQDIFDGIRSWKRIQAIKSQRYEARAKNRLIPPHAAGPRLR